MKNQPIPQPIPATNSPNDFTEAYRKAEEWLKANEWPVCDENIDFVLFGPQPHRAELLSESDVADLDAEAGAWDEERRSLGDFDDSMNG